MLATQPNLISEVWDRNNLSKDKTRCWPRTSKVALYFSMPPQIHTRHTCTGTQKKRKQCRKDGREEGQKKERERRRQTDRGKGREKKWVL